MKIATWNVNSLKVRLPHVLQWLGSHQPDVLAIQETKTVDEQFPANALAEAESKEIRLIDKAPRKGAEGLNIAFLHPKSTLGVLTELCEH